MTAEEQQIAKMEKETINRLISKRIGWLEQGDGFWRRPDGQTVNRAPDWASDLNAMAEAEKFLGDEQGANRRGQYERLLNHNVFATAEQRAKAFLTIIRYEYQYQKPEYHA